MNRFLASALAFSSFCTPAQAGVNVNHPISIYKYTESNYSKFISEDHCDRIIPVATIYSSLKSSENPLLHPKRVYLPKVNYVIEEVIVNKNNLDKAQSIFLDGNFIGYSYNGHEGSNLIKDIYVPKFDLVGAYYEIEDVCEWYKENVIFLIYNKHEGSYNDIYSHSEHFLRSMAVSEFHHILVHSIEEYGSSVRKEVLKMVIKDYGYAIKAMLKVDFENKLSTHLRFINTQKDIIVN